MRTLFKSIGGRYRKLIPFSRLISKGFSNKGHEGAVHFQEGHVVMKKGKKKTCNLSSRNSFNKAYK